MLQRIDFWQGGQFKAHPPNTDLKTTLDSVAGWLPAQVPGCVHLDLLRAEQIPDPFFGMNEADVAWVGEMDWLYTCTFHMSAEQLSAPHLDLCFDGLDTFAEVYLNGTHILSSQNMFLPQRVAVKMHLREGENRLVVLFESALRHGKAIEAQHVRRAVWNGDPSRVYVRKAQYHYGWDWGPTLLTAGIWRPVRLEAYAARLADLHIQPTLSDDLQHADLHISAQIEGAADALRVALYNPSGALIESVQVALNGTSAQHTFSLKQPQLWQPRGLGEQARYRVEATLLGAAGSLDSQSIRIGVRRIRLVQAPLPDEYGGTSFTFEVNNTPLFCGGANWIPADSFTPRLTATRYGEWLRLAAEANMRMLRVWGGGIYEDEAFYETCDALGLLVWQDFMFGCGMYPAHPEFLENVRAEATAQVKRLRHYACLVLWCGNNEDYQIAESLNAYDSTFNGDFTQTDFPAREIYERLLPQVCAEHDPTRPYWQGSSYGGSATVMDQTVGDRHTWEIWHGDMADYQEYFRYGGRFVSEFGMQGFPHPRTIESFTTPQDRTSESAVMVYHNKAGQGVMRLNHYLDRNTGRADSLGEYVYRTQFVQSEAAAAAFESWRLSWNTEGKRSLSGALIWQLNDCYPVISWALVDYYLRPKPAYYRTKRALAPLALLLQVDEKHVLSWAASDLLTPTAAHLTLACWSLSGELLSQARLDVQLGANQITPLMMQEQPSTAPRVWAARLWQNGQVVARAACFPEPPRSVNYSPAEVTLTALGEGRYQLSTDRPVRGVWLEAEDPDARWDDNMLDLLPNDPQVVRLISGTGGVQRIRWFGQTN